MVPYRDVRHLFLIATENILIVYSQTRNPLIYKVKTAIQKYPLGSEFAGQDISGKIGVRKRNPKLFKPIISDQFIFEV